MICKGQIWEYIEEDTSSANQPYIISDINPDKKTVKLRTIAGNKICNDSYSSHYLRRAKIWKLIYTPPMELCEKYNLILGSDFYDQTRTSI